MFNNLQLTGSTRLQSNCTQAVNDIVRPARQPFQIHDKALVSFWRKKQKENKRNGIGLSWQAGKGKESPKIVPGMYIILLQNPDTHAYHCTILQGADAWEGM